MTVDTVLELPAITWFHSFALPDGEKIAGIKSIECLNAEADVIFPADLPGLSVLDIGSWDGFFSFEAERRGARDVLATDHFCWSGEGWGTREGFDYIHARLNSSVRAQDVDVPNLDPAVLGRFDLVLLLGVLYHVKDPYRCLEAAATMCSDHLVVETVTAMAHEPMPVMRLFRPMELADDPTNFWAPNVPAMEVMLTNMGFSRIEAVLSPVSAKPKRSIPNFVQRALGDDASRRMIIHAWR
jgi:tRNA (mo5U34)-methyltransferase